MNAADNSFDEAYARWKRWGQPASYGKGDKKIWDDLHRLAGISPGRKLLEIGFGQGSHLHYCQSKGVTCVGIEQNKKGLELAAAAGLRVYLGDLDVLPATDNHFDVIAAFDVIEHVPLPELVAMMKSARKLLKDDGKVLLVFPNGASPFGRLHQHGDLTHVNAFNRSSLDQLGVMTGFRITAYENFPEYFDYGSPAALIKAPLRKLVRAAVGIAVRGYFDEPLGLSIAAVLEKAPDF